MKIITEKGNYEIITILSILLFLCACGWYMEHKSYKYLKTDFQNYTKGIHDIFENDKEVLEEIKSFEEDLMDEKFAEADARSEYSYHQR